jgi:uncharacterized protein
MVTEYRVNSTISPFEQGNPASFFDHVAENVDWTITGRGHQLSGRYTSKADVLSKTLNRMTQCMATPMKRKITSVLISGDWAVVEHTADATTKKGSEFHQEFCWICRFEGDMIVEVKMYMDTAVVETVLSENE